MSKNSFHSLSSVGQALGTVFGMNSTLNQQLLPSAADHDDLRIYTNSMEQGCYYTPLLKPTAGTFNLYFIVLMSTFFSVSRRKIALRYPRHRVFKMNFRLANFPLVVLPTTHGGSRTVHHRISGFAGHSLADDLSCVHRHDKTELNKRRRWLARSFRSSHWSERVHAHF
jgi:hypothetical protein